MYMQIIGVILRIECARGKTCLRMTAFCTATGRHVQVTILTTDAARACPNRVKFSESGYADDKSSAFSGPSTDNRGASSPIILCIVYGLSACPPFLLMLSFSA